MVLSTPLSYSTYNILPLTPPPLTKHTYFFSLSFIFNPDFNIHVHIICHNHILVVYKIYYYTHKGKKHFYNTGISLYQYRVAPNHTKHTCFPMYPQFLNQT